MLLFHCREDDIKSLHDLEIVRAKRPDLVRFVPMFPLNLFLPTFFFLGD